MKQITEITSCENDASYACFQASAAKQLRTALLWVVTQRVVVRITNERVSKMGSDKFSSARVLNPFLEVNYKQILNKNYTCFPPSPNILHPSDASSFIALNILYETTH